MTDCKYWNESWGPSFAGRCSAPDDVGTNAVNKVCMSPQTCPYLLEPLYKRKSQMKNQEILNALNEKIKAAEEALLYLNQTKAGLERVIANSSKTPVEEAYKDWYGEYPSDGIAIDNSWDAFQAGYNAAYEEKVVKREEDYPYKKYTPEETEQSLKQAFHEAIKQGVVSSSTKQLTLYDICINWWRDLHDSCDMNISIEDLVNRIVKEWLPKEMKDDCEGFWTDGYNDYRKSLIRRLK